MKVNFHDEDGCEDVHFFRSPSGKFEGAAVVTCYDSRGAEQFKRRFDQWKFWGRKLCVVNY